MCIRNADPCKVLSVQQFVRARETACAFLEKKENVCINIFKNRLFIQLEVLNFISKLLRPVFACSNVTVKDRQLIRCTYVFKYRGILLLKLYKQERL